MVASEISYIPEFDGWLFINWVDHWAAFKHSNQRYYSFMALELAFFCKIYVLRKLIGDKIVLKVADEQCLESLWESNRSNGSFEISELSN